MREGFILTAYFAEALPAYEKQEQALRLYLPEMLSAIDVAKEDRRIAKVDFLSRRETRRVAAPAPVEPAKPALETELEAAEKAFEQRQLEPARAGFRKALQTEAPKPLHARAYYGLARLAVLDKQPDLAEKLFERTLELDPDSFVKGWAHVYLARLAQEIRKTHLADGRADDAARETQRAVGHYRAALAVEGLSTGARRAAEQGLEQLAAAKN
jgi:tetratricopeptide (TPR) repeat protein